ncbi:MAG: YtxH domain-containing protein [Syntrophobacteraceae bacterium]
MLKNFIMVGGSAMIMKEIADRLQQARIDREKALRRKKTGILALGVAIGAVAGVLFAPKAGKETREDLTQRGCTAWEKIKENASHTGHRLISAIEEKSSSVRTAAKGSLKELPAEDEGTDKKH